MKRDDLKCMVWARAIGGVRRRSDRKPLPSRELKQTMAHEDGRITDVHGRKTAIFAVKRVGCVPG